MKLNRGCFTVQVDLKHIAKETQEFLKAKIKTTNWDIRHWLTGSVIWSKPNRTPQNCHYLETKGQLYMTTLINHFLGEGGKKRRNWGLKPRIYWFIYPNLFKMIHSLLAFIEEKCMIWFYPSLHSNSLWYLSKQYEKIIMLIKKLQSIFSNNTPHGLSWLSHRTPSKRSAVSSIQTNLSKQPSH